eukprot:CAMPEP_0197024204 /NCGR_PEP_ID=MMETSP1384-20130603/4819_1 /TAXON_ID=29189 /ORGANISM="Ammonia sp." /LENGTH=334 /DNA_ID=CAMNT_0042452551 /DNA_START=339 /DNA_END=1340 /DNA_ORIENTATION=-
MAASVPLDWIYGVIGGAFIGISSALYLSLTGRIAGISGIFGVIVNHILSLGRDASKSACSAQFGFFAGLISGGVYWNFVSLSANGAVDLHGMLPTKIEPFQALNYSPYVMLSSGLFVGIGTKVGNGCTSGHGVCGLARRSLRSLSAVTTFMITAFITTTMASTYFAHLYETQDIDAGRYDSSAFAQVSEYVLACLIGVLLLGGVLAGNFMSFLSSLLCGFLFATGLIYSGMSNPNKIRAAFNLNPVDFANRFDPSLFFVFVGALTNSAVLFPVIRTFRKRPLCCDEWCIPTNTKVDARLITGAFIFGIGWGIGGLCPGPAFVSLASKAATVPIW